ncbi:11313_t:CDS:2, partial [Racocetra persica]
SKNNLDKGNKSVLSLSDTEIVPNYISEQWYLFKEKLLELANREGLFVESHTQQILSLSHILLLKSRQYCLLMVEVFGDELLVTMHEHIIQKFTKQETEFDNKLLIKLVRIVKEYYRSNKEAVKSKARKLVSKAKQPDAIINEINQLSWSLSKKHGEAKVQEEMNSLYFLCTNLIWIAIFNKNAINFYNMNCILRFQIVASYHILSHHSFVCDALYVMVEVGHVDVSMLLEQVSAFLTSLDMLLIILNTYWSNYIMSTEKKEPSKHSTLATPSFKKIVSKSLKDNFDKMIMKAFEENEARIEKEKQNKKSSNVVTLARDGFGRSWLVITGY